VLVAEDNRTNQKYAEAILKRLGCEAVIAETGQQAIDLLGSEPFDLCLMDLHLPDMDGLTVTQVIQREMHLEVPIVALTAAATTEDRRACLSRGMAGFLTKPFKAADLKKIIDDLVGVQPSS